MDALSAAREAWRRARDTNAISHPLFDEARAQAATAPAPATGGAPRPLEGWPAVVKDMIDVAGAPCTAGLAVFADRIATADATLVARLKAAGALIVGLTTTDSAGFGVTTPAVRHPVWAGQIVGGSSGGSAAAVRAGIARIALGTDTGGSCRIPAACCAIAGFKPTRGLLPLDGILPLSPSLDHAGLLGARVKDIALAFAALTGRSPTAGMAARAPMRVGFEAGMLDECAPAQRRGVARVLELVRAAGAAVAPVRLPGREAYAAIHAKVFCFEAAATHQALGSGRWADYPALARRYLAFGARLTREDYDRALERSRALAEEAAAPFRTADILIAPTLAVPVPRRDAGKVVLGGRAVDVAAALLRFTAPFNHTGQPVLSVPVVNDPEMQDGGPRDAASVQIVAPGGADDAVLAAGMWLQGALAATPGG